MERPWPDEALDYEAAVRGALARAGGVELARRCEADPSLRVSEVLPVLEGLGLLELDVTAGALEAAAAARAMSAAGAVACPWPLVAQLAIPSAARADVGAVYLGDGTCTRAEHLDLLEQAVVVDVATGDVLALRPVAAEIVRMPLDPFGVPCAPAEAVAIDLAGVENAHVVLTAFWVVGVLGHARDLAAAHARERRQFDRRIADFGAIQWHLSDIAVAHDSLWELAGFSLARLIDGRLTPADMLALRLTTLDAAHVVLAHAHQVLAAIGLCEEHDLVVLDRHVQPSLRRPCGVTRTLGLLVDAIERSGFDNVYSLAAKTTDPVPVGVPDSMI